MKPAMTDPETELLSCFLQCARTYVEFGCGGSTVLAADLVQETIISVDSSTAWLDSVLEACSGKRIRPDLIFADIGAVGEWGAPIEAGARERWPSYHRKAWEDPRAAGADLFLIDGRFRVACALQAIRRCKAMSIILVHDFAIRSEYQILHEVASEIARCGTLSAFLPKAFSNSTVLDFMIDAYKYDPA